MSRRCIHMRRPPPKLPLEKAIVHISTFLRGIMNRLPTFVPQRYRNYLLAVALAIALACPHVMAMCALSSTSPSVTVCTPTNGAGVSSPVHIIAGSTDTHAVTLMQVYVDGVKKYE